MKYPYAKHSISEDDIEAVSDVLKNKSLTQGEEVRKFEIDLALYLDCKEVVVCANGTAALHLSYLSLGLKKGKGLLTTPITFLATANAAKMTGAQIYFCDVDPLTGIVTPETLNASLKKYKGKINLVSIVHLGWKICDVAAIKAVLEKYNIPLLEDSCHVLGSSYISKSGKIEKAGTPKYSNVATFSFHAIKNITTGEGGAIATNNKKLAEKIRLLRSHGTIREKEWNYNSSKGPWYYSADVLGYNYRLTDFQSALGRSQLRNLHIKNKEKTLIARKYNEYLSKSGIITLPILSTSEIDCSWHLYSILIDFTKIKNSKLHIMHKLYKAGIGTQVHYIPLYHQGIYKKPYMQKLKGAELYYKSSLSLPIYSGLDNEGINYISKVLLENLNK